jgi:hypothetical protein
MHHHFQAHRGANVSLNDENTRAAIVAVGDQVASLFSHFLSGPDASWDSFTYGASEFYLERLKIGLDQLSMCVEAEMITRQVVQPTELGV